MVVALNLFLQNSIIESETLFLEVWLGWGGGGGGGESSSSLPSPEVVLTGPN